MSHHSLSALQRKKFNKIKLLPLTNYLQIWRKHLLERLSVVTRSLDEASNLQVGKELAEMTLTRLIIFNKRRGGEAAKIQLSSFENRPDWNTTSVEGIKSTLQPVEKELCKSYSTLNDYLKLKHDYIH